MSDDEQVVCPTCIRRFDSVHGMKIHHSQVHDWSLPYTFGDHEDFFDEGHTVLVTAFDEEIEECEQLYGRLITDEFDLAFETRGETWRITYYAGRDPAGYYVHPPDTHLDGVNDEHVGYVARLQLVDHLRVEAGETDLETSYEGCRDFEEVVGQGL